MTKLQKYIKDNPDYDMHTVDKKFGNGKTLIQFFYREQVTKFKQGFLAYVDSMAWDKDHHDVMSEVQKYVAETNGVIDKTDFKYDMQEDGFECCINTKNNSSCDLHEKDFDEWLKSQFPKIDLEYGGVCFFDKV
jgi:hypothetical protein